MFLPDVGEHAGLCQEGKKDQRGGNPPSSGAGEGCELPAAFPSIPPASCPPLLPAAASAAAHCLCLQAAATPYSPKASDPARQLSRGETSSSLAVFPPR